MTGPAVARSTARKQSRLLALVGRRGGIGPASLDEWSIARKQPRQPALVRRRGRIGPESPGERPTGTQARVAAADSALPEVRPTTGALRATRGIALAAASAAIALAGHVLGGGHAPSIPALIVVAGLVGAGFVVLADRRRNFAQILIGALASQPVFHFAFSLAEHHGPADPHGGRASADELAALSQQTSAADLVHQLQAALDPSMVAGHVVAAVGIAALTAHGENLLWSLFELVARTTAPILEPVPVQAAAPAAPRAATNLIAPPRRQQLARVRTRRGPPALLG